MSKKKKSSGKKSAEYIPLDTAYAPHCFYPAFNAQPPVEIPSHDPSYPEGRNDDTPQGRNVVDDNGACVKEYGIAAAGGGKHNIYCLNIIGQIEGHYTLPPDAKTTKYEHIIPSLVAVEQDENAEGLIILLNTVGGDVEAGLAIAELVAGMKTPTASIVLGGGHSIGVPLAVCAKRTFIVPSATMTIHPVRMNGPIVGVPQTISYFMKMQDRIIRFITDNSKITEKKLRELLMATGEIVMDIGTVVDGKQAVEAGLIDAIGGLSDAVQWLYSEIERGDKDRPTPA